MDVVKLVRYILEAQRRYLKTLKELPWNEVIRERGASFSSLRDIFLHMLTMEDRLINYVIPGRVEKWVSEDPEKFIDMNKIEERVDNIEKKVDAYLVNLTQDELDRKVEVPRRRGPSSLMRVEDILVQVVIENTSHMGELIALMWQFDKEPPFLSWNSFLEQSA